MRFAADGVDAAIRSATSRHFLQTFVDVFFLEVDRLGLTEPLGELEALRHTLDRDHTAGSEHPCALNREMTDRTAAPHRYRIARLDLRVFGGHVARRKDVGEEQHFLILQARLDLERAHVGKGNAQVLRLTPRKPAEQVREAEGSAG